MLYLHKFILETDKDKEPLYARLNPFKIPR